MVVAAQTWLRAGVVVFVAVVAVLVLRGAGRPGASSPSMHWTQHLDDLRRRLLVSMAALLGASAFVFSFRWDRGSWYPVPALHDNLAAQAFHRLASDLVPTGVTLVQVRPLDGFMAELAIAFGIAAILTLPITVGQLGGFLLPALKPQERRALRSAFLPMLLLFAAGVSFCYAYVLPFMFGTLYGYGTALGAQPLLEISELVSFSVSLLLVFGAAFQTPVVMYALSRVGLVEAATWTSKWRHATIAIFVVAALVTDPTVISQVLVALPLLGLYGLGIVAAMVAERRALAKSTEISSTSR